MTYFEELSDSIRKSLEAYHVKSENIAALEDDSTPVHVAMRFPNPACVNEHTTRN